LRGICVKLLAAMMIVSSVLSLTRSLNQQFRLHFHLQRSWAKVARGLSAGRVQSVAVKLLVEREKEINAFIPEEYWDVVANVKESKQAELTLDVKT